MIKILGNVINERVILCDYGIICTVCQVLFLDPQHLQTAIPNLFLIKPALLQMLYELRVIPLESSQQIAMRKLSKTNIYSSEILQ